MAVVAEFDLPVDAFVLGRTLRRFPEMRVELEQIVPTHEGHLPYVWTADEGAADFAAVAEADPTVRRLDCVAEFDVGALYCAAWREFDCAVFDALERSEGSVLQTEDDVTGWWLKSRFGSRRELGRFAERLDEADVEFRTRRLFDLEERKMGQYNVTRKQRETLIAALEMGYFAIPRGATLDEVADRLGVSTKAASERLRRGCTNLVSNTVSVGQPSGIGIDTT